MARPGSETVGLKIDGLDDFRRDLVRMSGSITGKDFGRVNKSVAEYIVEKSDEVGLRLGGVHAHVVRNRSQRALGAAKAAQVIVGGSAAKHGPALGAEFGSKRYTQFPPWRGNQFTGGDVGYMLHPAIRDNETEWVDMYWQGIEGIAKKSAFPD